jgi:hypothetical protein
VAREGIYTRARALSRDTSPSSKRLPKHPPTNNIYNYSRLVVTVTNNLIGLIFSRVGYRDLGICFSNKLGL